MSSINDHHDWLATYGELALKRDSNPAGLTDQERELLHLLESSVVYSGNEDSTGLEHTVHELMESIGRQAAEAIPSDHVELASHGQAADTPSPLTQPIGGTAADDTPDELTLGSAVQQAESHGHRRITLGLVGMVDDDSPWAEVVFAKIEGEFITLMSPAEIEVIWKHEGIPLPLAAGDERRLHFSVIKQTVLRFTDGVRPRLEVG